MPVPSTSLRAGIVVRILDIWQMESPGGAAVSMQFMKCTSHPTINELQMHIIRIQRVTSGLKSHLHPVPALVDHVYPRHVTRDIAVLNVAAADPESAHFIKIFGGNPPI